MPSGRTVRCSNCGHTWYQEAPYDSPIGSSVEDDYLETPLGLPLGSSPERSSNWIGHTAAWLVFLLVLGTLTTGVYKYRVAIVQLWPKSSILYSTLGIPVNTRGLAFRNTVYAQFNENEMPVLTISGVVENLTNEALPLPPIRVSLRDHLQREIYKWTFTMAQDHLDAFGKGRFETKLGNPPADAQDLVVTFAAADSFR